MSEQHWTETFEHEKLATPEAREELKRICGAYKTPEDAILGGMEHKKMLGKKLENVIQKPGKDAKPEEVQEYQTSLLKELGAVDKEDDLADLDVKAGLRDGVPVDDNLAADFKKFVIANKYPKQMAQKAIEFYNQAIAKAAEAQQAQALKNAETTQAALVKKYGTAEKVAELSELFRRAVKDTFGFTAEEYEQSGEALAKIINQNPLAARIMLEAVAPRAAEGRTETGGGAGSKGNPPASINSELPKTAKALGWT